MPPRSKGQAETTQFRWIEDPWHDSCRATFRHAWEIMRVAFLCWLLGHYGTEHQADSLNPSWRICARCDGKWEYRTY